MPSDKQRRVLDAAMQVFMRYGYRRVTMGDIAKAAGMSRPALYLVYPCKEEILKAGVKEFVGEALDEVERGLGAEPTVHGKLNHAFAIWIVRSFELIHSSPDAKEVIEVGHGLSTEVLEDGYRRFEALLERIIAPEARELRRRKLSAKKLAHVAALAARGIKEGAQDKAELQELTEALIAMILATLESPEAPTKKS